MKTISILIFTAILTMALADFNFCRGQIAIIGNITAEVIESVSVSGEFQTFTNLEFENTVAPDTGSSVQSPITSGVIDLGSITINSGNNITCNIVVFQASLSDSVGNGFTLDPSIKTDSFATSSKSNGTQTIQLDGKANLALSQASGIYEGSYSVVVAYN
jgi:hypothetical protein